MVDWRKSIIYLIRKEINPNPCLGSKLQGARAGKAPGDCYFWAGAEVLGDFQIILYHTENVTGRCDGMNGGGAE